MTSFKN